MIDRLDHEAGRYEPGFELGGIEHPADMLELELDFERARPRLALHAERDHQRGEPPHCVTGAPPSKRSPGKYFARRSSAVRACASIPSSREIRAVTCAMSRFASRDMRCHVTVLMNLCTDRPPE